MNIDPNTGLPELPDGHFWRVTRSIIGDYLRVELHKARRFGQPVRLDFDMARANYGRSIEASISAAAREVYTRQFGNPRYAHLLGDYPPKKLEVNS